jgi:hypothetical protein
LHKDGDVSQVYVRGPGCDKCNHEGTGPRFGIMEVVISDAQLMSDFIRRGTAIARRNYHARPDADPPLLESAIAHVLSGKVDPNHVQERVDVIVRKDRFHDVMDHADPLAAVPGYVKPANGMPGYLPGYPMPAYPMAAYGMPHQHVVRRRVPLRMLRGVQRRPAPRTTLEVVNG